MAPVSRGIPRKSFLATGAAAVAGASSGAAAFAQAGDTPLGGTVTIGVVAPFSGDSIKLGEQIGNGVRAAVNDANLLRGTLDKAYVMKTFDDQNLLATGLVNAEFACDDPQVIAVIGHLSGRITDAALRTYNNNKMPVICPVSSYERLTQHGFGNILRLTAKDSTEGRLAAQYVTAKEKPKSVVVLYQDGDYGFDVASGFQDQMPSSKIASTPIVFSWDKPDWDAVVKSVTAKNPDVVFLAGTTKDMGPIFAHLAVVGFKGPYYASQGFFDPATIATYGSAVEGLVISTSMPPLAIAPGAFRIRNDFERHYGPFTPLSAFSYAAAQIVIAVVRRTSAVDRIAVQRSLAFGTSFDTVVGEMQFQNDGDPQNPNVYFYTVANGKWKYSSSAFPSSFIVK
ncbi:MAG: branched-chain amino acid ABC transporter substrate-binding protein [Candidatus Eremiobacteraeota bacterium]|nr:branched-chain amino acid ABC transporter substrate-binding protein [Candidatus Eremiobacteraeota bacterium]